MFISVDFRELCAYAMIVMSEKIMKTQKNGGINPEVKGPRTGKNQEFSEVRVIEVSV